MKEKQGFNLELTGLPAVGGTSFPVISVQFLLDLLALFSKLETLNSILF